MAAQIPIKDNPAANDKAMDGVRADKLREVRAGHDGTWVAHPALAAIASDVFNKHMPTPNQLFVRREDVHVTANDLLNTNVPGSITEDGIRKNLNIGLCYMEGWLRGIGCVPINYLMVRFISHPARISVRTLTTSRRMPLPLKSPAASSGSGPATTQRLRKARRSTRLTPCVCCRNRPNTWRRRARAATSSSWRDDTSLARSRVRITPSS